MPVLIEGISVVVRCDAISDRFDGGLAAFLEAIPNATYCSDGDLARVGFLDPADVGAYIQTLESAGLRVIIEGLFVDAAVVDQQRGPTLPCKWLEFTKLSIGDRDKVSVGWLFEGQRIAHGLHLPSNGMDLATPAGWTFEGSLSEKFLFVPFDGSEPSNRKGS